MVQQSLESVVKSACRLHGLRGRPEGHGQDLQEALRRTDLQAEVMSNKRRFLDSFSGTWSARNEKVHSGPAGVMSAATGSSQEAVQDSCASQVSKDMKQQMSLVTQRRLASKQALSQDGNTRSKAYAVSGPLR